MWWSMSARVLVIFDLDGTLLQTQFITVPAVQQAFANFGLPIPDPAAIVSFFGRPVEDYHAWLARQSLRPLTAESWS